MNKLSAASGERLQGIVYHLLLATVTALLAWLSLQHATYWDWTDNRRNSLAAESLALLDKLETPLRMTSYAPDRPELRKRIDRLLERYRRTSPQWVVTRYIDPELHPEQARQAGVELAGELILEYQDRSERLRVLSEEQIANALLRLLGRPERWIAGLGGHGERHLAGTANHDLGDFGSALEQHGYRVQTLDLASVAGLPHNLGLLILAGPQLPLPKADVRRLQKYLKDGGNLLWLMDPDGPSQEPLAQSLGVTPLPGRIVDANVADLGVEDPTIALVSNYPDHPATRGFDLLSLYPQSLALEAIEASTWRATPLLQTLPRSWNETGQVQGQIRQDPERGERPGPLTLGLALERELSDSNGTRHQRALVLGDGDFLANAFLANAGNRELGLRLVRWLMEDDALLHIPPRTTPDRELHIDRNMALVLGVGGLLVAPLGFLLAGLLIRRARNRG